MTHFITYSLSLALYWIELSVLTIILYLLSWLPAKITNGFYHALFRAWCWTFVRALGVNLRLHQKNARPLPKQFILVSNHPSAVEDIGIPSLFDVYPLAKMGVKKMPLIGRINLAAGTIFVKRDDKDSRRAAVEALKVLLEKGYNIVLFPEGGCMGRRIHSSFRYGAFDISINSGLPIVPLFLHYEAQEAFEWAPAYSIFEKIWHFITSPNHRANYYVFDAVYPQGFNDKETYAKHVHNLYLQWQSRYLE